MEWLTGVFPDGYASAIVWLVAALVLLVAVLFLIRLLRRFGSGTFVAGGRNRRARLAVMDAAAVDSRRRLVLVRRDDVEHLILIGGPTDVVVEQDIRLGGRPNRTLAAADLAEAEPEPEHSGIVERAREPEVARAAQNPEPAQPPQPQRRPEPQPVPERPSRPVVEPTQATPQRPPSPQYVAPPRPPAPVAAAPSPRPPEARPVSAAPQYPVRAPLEPSSNVRLPEPQPVPAPASAVAAATVTAPATAAAMPAMAPPVTKPAAAENLDDDLLNELEMSFDDARPIETPAEETSLEDEMSKLLGELSADRR